MNPTEYVAGVLETESKPQVLHFGPLATHALLGLMIQTANLADIAKKAIFYGDKKPIDPEKLALLGHEISELGAFFANTTPAELQDLKDFEQYDELPSDLPHGTDGINKRLLHVGIGVFTEAGEMLEALMESWRTHLPVDRVNFAEELGDAFWYLGVGSDELKVPFEVLFQQNNTKLLDKKNGRYKRGSFDVDAAHNRELSGERQLLKGALTDAAAYSLKTSENANGQLYVSGVNTALTAQTLHAGELVARIATQNPAIFYVPATEDFIAYDETGAVLGNRESFDSARELVLQRQAELSGQPTTQGILGKLKSAGEDTVELVKAAFNKGDKQ